MQSVDIEKQTIYGGVHNTLKCKKVQAEFFLVDNNLFFQALASK